MALIPCPECGKEISSRAEICVHCGFPFKRFQEELSEEKQLNEEQMEHELAMQAAIERVGRAVAPVPLSIVQDLSVRLSNGPARQFSVKSIDSALWTGAGCKCYLVDTSGARIGGKNAVWEIVSEDERDGEIFLTIYEKNPLQKYKVLRVEVIAPGDATVYGLEERTKLLERMAHRMKSKEEEGGAQEMKFSSVPVCPRCGSKSIQVMKKGFSAGNAALGGILLGPLGVLAGAAGGNEIERVCMNCGHKF